MEKTLLILLGIIPIWLLIRYFYNKPKTDNYNRGIGDYNKSADNYNKETPKEKEEAGSRKTFGLFSIFKKKNTDKPRPKLFAGFFTPSVPFDNEALIWCANLLNIEKADLKTILFTIPGQYEEFKIRKRSGGFRTISSPKEKLAAIQRTIYLRILLPVNIHPAATGFRQGISVVDNAKVHLGKRNILKTDVINFFGSIHLHTVIKAFERIGYPQNISKVLAELCCLKKNLPQGASTSPALSNIISYEMDKKLAALANNHQLAYSRYADDLTFSGDSISKDLILTEITNIVRSEGFALSMKKTRFISENRRKIITGISISSGTKLTIPKAKKRELRQNVHYILTKSLAKHQQHIKSNAPAYLKRILGYLSFWLSVEPDNKYVIDSIKALRKLNK